MINSRALVLASLLGTMLQVGMVLAGHSNPSIAALFAVGGMGLSLLAGIVYAFKAGGGSAGSLALGGMLAGAICALIGIFVSYLLGDVPMSLLALGTISSAVTGAIGGWLGKFFARAGVVAIIALSFARPNDNADAQSPRLAANTKPAESTAKVATTRDLSWIVGHWEGKMTGGPGVADVTFAAPAGGLITGMMRLIDGNKVLVVELISLVDTPAGVELRFRHFSSALDVYEPVFKQNMLLKSHTTDADVFENLVPYDKALMSTQPRTATWKRLNANAFVGHSDIVNDDGTPGVVEVTYTRVK